MTVLSNPYAVRTVYVNHSSGRPHQQDATPKHYRFIAVEMYFSGLVFRSALVSSVLLAAANTSSTWYCDNVPNHRDIGTRTIVRGPRGWLRSQGHMRLDLGRPFL